MILPGNEAGEVAITQLYYPAITQIAKDRAGHGRTGIRRKLLTGIKKATRMDRLIHAIGGAGGSRTPVRKHSAVGTTCLVPSLALATTVQDGHHTEQRAHYWFSDPV